VGLTAAGGQILLLFSSWAPTRRVSVACARSVCWEQRQRFFSNDSSSTELRMALFARALFFALAELIVAARVGALPFYQRAGRG